MIIDIEKLRNDLILYYEAAYFVGGIKTAIFDIDDIEKASCEELINIANNLGFDLNNYNINDDSKKYYK